jgi:two-component system phosphate regulon sensor histidine kinase PhoR
VAWLALRRPRKKEEFGLGKKLLMIDDDLALCESVCQFCESQGWEGRKAVSGVEGWVMIETFSPDLVLLDLVISDLDGFSICQKIKQHPRFAKTPVIILTALEDEASIRKAILCGASGYIVKPCAPESLGYLMSLYGENPITGTAINPAPKESHPSPSYVQLEGECRRLKTLLDQKRLECEIISTILQMCDAESDFVYLVDYLTDVIYSLVKPATVSLMSLPDRSPRWNVKGLCLNDRLKAQVIQECRQFLEQSSPRHARYRYPKIRWDFDSSESWMAGTRFYSKILVPLVYQKEVIGAMGVFHTQPNVFSPQQEVMLKAISNYLMLGSYRLWQIGSAETLKREAILNSMQEGVVFIDKRSAQVFYNPAAMHLFSLKSRMGTYSDFREAIQWDPVRELDESSASHIHHITEITAQPQDLTFFRVSDEQRNQYGVMGVIRDIADEIKLEKMVNEFISIAAHELRTPLAIIKGSIDLVSHGPTGEDQKHRLLAMAEKQVDRMAKIVTKIADIHSYESKKNGISKRKILLQAHIDPVIEQYRKMAAEKQVRMQVFLPSLLLENPVFVRANPECLNKILAELLDNAVRVSPERGLITVKGTIDDRFVRIDVEDQGRGIYPAERAYIFKKFKQAEQTLRRTIEGPGLGLPLARILVQKFGGELGLHSQPGKGSIFYFTVPVAYKYRVLHASTQEEPVKSYFPFEQFQFLSLPSQQALKRMYDGDLDMIVLTQRDKELLGYLKASSSCCDIPVLYWGDFGDEEMRTQNTRQVDPHRKELALALDKIFTEVLDGYEFERARNSAEAA